MSRAPSRSPQAWVLACALVAIVLGIALRFASLDAPLFWQDEAYTALRATGHLERDYLRLFDGRTHGVAEIRVFETIDPARGGPAVVRALAREDPHHSPLFYALDRMWIGAFGTSPGGFRGLSAALGTIGIALAYGLGAALGRSRIAGAIAASLIALSPIFVLYSRQAREYALFADATMLATLVLVRAVRAPSPAVWFAYAATAALGLYVDPIFALVSIAHLVVVLLEPSRRLRRAGAWLAATTGGLVLFAPWAFNAYRSSANIAGQLDWGRTAYPLKFLAMKWLFNVGALGFDGEFANLALAPVAAMVVLGVLAALGAFVRYGDRFAVRMLVPLGAIPLVVFIVRDALFNSHFEVIVRYLTPLWLCALFAASLALAQAMAAAPRFRAIARGAWLAALAAGLSAGLIRGGAENWWDNNDQIAFQALAREIDAVERPLVISERHPHVPLVMARYLRDDAAFVLLPGDGPPVLPDGRRAFVVAPSRALLDALARRTRGRYAIENVSPPARTAIGAFHQGLWRAAPAVDRGDYTVFIPPNALWTLRPLGAAQAKTGLRARRSDAASAAAWTPTGTTSNIER